MRKIHPVIGHKSLFVYRMICLFLLTVSSSNGIMDYFTFKGVCANFQNKALFRQIPLNSVPFIRICPTTSPFSIERPGGKPPDKNQGFTAVYLWVYSEKSTNDIRYLPGIFHLLPFFIKFYFF